MHETFRNVNDAFQTFVTLISRNLLPSLYMSPSRAGDVIAVDEPVTITYSYPQQRVLFNEARDANPFFHLYESLWMLAGRSDVAPLAYYNSKIADIASDDGETFNGAYGYRWRHSYVRSIPKGEEPVGFHDGGINQLEETFRDGLVDQLSLLVNHLKKTPNSRRAVLQIWSVQDDLLKVDCAKDVACNTHVYFSLREYDKIVGPEEMVINCINAPLPRCLDMTVCNRSNDLIWGALGANVVHFSFLQEYLAAHLGVELGVYNQFTNNLHVYEERWEPRKLLREYDRNMHSAPPIDYDQLTLVPLVKDPEVFDRELPEFVERHSKDSVAGQYSEPFLRDVVQPMCMAFHHHKRREYSNALTATRSIRADDWRIVATRWLEKRKAAYERRTKDVSTSANKA